MKRRLDEVEGGWLADDAPYENEAREILDRIKDLDDETTGIVLEILVEYVRRRENPGRDFADTMARRVALVNGLPDMLSRIEAAMRDGTAVDSLSSAYDSLSAAYIHLAQNIPDFVEESRARARDSTVASLMMLATQRGLNGERMILQSGLIEYRSELQFRKALQRAVKDFSGQK